MGTIELGPSHHEEHTSRAWQIGLATHPGQVREENEDASFVLQFILSHEGQATLPLGLFIVADGMGGHAGGQRASSLATRLVVDHVIRQLCLPQLSPAEGGMGPAPIHEILESSFGLAHRAVQDRIPGGGTTMTLALILGSSIHVAHVGDSRAYIGSQGRLRQVTTDHSVAARLVETGQVTRSQAAAQRSLLYKALGKGLQAQPDIKVETLDNAQYLLLCCDGLWSMVADEEIAAIITASSTPQAACLNLVSEANNRGGEDNITALLISPREWPDSEQKI